MASNIRQIPPRNVQEQMADAALAVISAFEGMGRHCLVEKHSGSTARVASVAVSRDMAEAFAHITTNLGRSDSEGLEVHVIKLNEIVRVTCAHSGRVVLDLEPYEII